MVYNSSGKTAVEIPRKEIEKSHCTSERFFSSRSPTQSPIRISPPFLPLSYRCLFPAVSLILKWFLNESSYLRELRRNFNSTLFSHLHFFNMFITCSVLPLGSMLLCFLSCKARTLGSNDPCNKIHTDKKKM